MADGFKVYAAKRYMEYVRTSRNSVRQTQEAIEQMREDLAGLKAIVYSSIPGSPNAYGDAIPDGVIRIDEAIRVYTTELAEWLDVEDEAHESIKRIADGRHREILWSHYVSQKSWEQIAVDMGYSYDYVRKDLFESSLEALYAAMPEQWRRDFPNAI